VVPSAGPEISILIVAGAALTAPAELDVLALSLDPHPLAVSAAVATNTENVRRPIAPPQDSELGDPAQHSSGLQSHAA
jgi:hypothetical protein